MIIIRAKLWLGKTITFIIAFAIIYLSHQPGSGALPDFPHQDKLFHFIAYFLLGLFARIGWPNLDGKKYLLFATLFAASDEIHQYFVPLRSCDFWDWLADNLGILAALWIVKFGSSLKNVGATNE